MDTRFWGPSGWRLLHLITFAYNPKKDRASMAKFLESLPYVLPCKFCRSSLVAYYQELPYTQYLDSERALSQWMWKIHGKVNEKLRSQGQTIPKDPSYSQVREIYLDRLHYGCTRTDFPGWEFLFSIAENIHSNEPSTPISGAPPLEDINEKDELTLLHWNYLTQKRREAKVCEFWSILPKVLPFADWRTAWTKHAVAFNCHTTADKRTLWKLRCAFESELDLVNRTEFRALCNDLKFHRSGCATKRNARTCRRLRKPTQNTRKR
jgi:hypothetical protein